MTVTKDTVIYDIIEQEPKAEMFFMAVGMHCIRCEMATMETVEQACMVHGINADELVAGLNEFIAAQSAVKAQ